MNKIMPKAEGIVTAAQVTEIAAKVLCKRVTCHGINCDECALNDGESLELYLKENSDAKENNS